MFDLHKDTALITLGFTSTVLFIIYDKRAKTNHPFKEIYKTNSLAQLLSLLIWGSAIYIGFRNLTWWKAIIDLILSFIIANIVALIISRFLSTKFLFNISIILMLITLVLMAINII